MFPAPVSRIGCGHCRSYHHVSCRSRRGDPEKVNLLGIPRQIAPQHRKPLARIQGLDILTWDRKGAL
jgi:hypothetical protein